MIKELRYCMMPIILLFILTISIGLILKFFKKEYALYYFPWLFNKEEINLLKLKNLRSKFVSFFSKKNIYLKSKNINDEIRYFILTDLDFISEFTKFLNIMNKEINQLNFEVNNKDFKEAITIFENSKYPDFVLEGKKTREINLEEFLYLISFLQNNNKSNIKFNIELASV